MSAEEKAEYLIEKFQDITALKVTLDYDTTVSEIINHAKQCALICVNEMIEQNGELYLNGIDEKYYRKKNAELFELKSIIEKQ